MLVSPHASATSSVGPIASSVWIGSISRWGAVLGRTAQRLIDFEQTSEAAVARIDRRRFLVRLGRYDASYHGGRAVVSVTSYQSSIDAQTPRRSLQEIREQFGNT
jgi:hypothetical protein